MTTSFTLVPPSHLTEAHPVLFQRPETDKLLQGNAMAQWTTDPTKIWIPSEETEKHISPFIPRPEMARLMAMYKPVARPPHERVREDLLYNVFYSQGNIMYIQKAIVAQVKQIGQFNVPPPNASAILTIMGKVFIEYAEHINEDTLPIKTIVDLTRNQVKRLNSLTVNMAVPLIVDNADALHKTTQRILGNTTDLLPRAIDTSIRGTIETRPIESVLDG